MDQDAKTKKLIKEHFYGKALSGQGLTKTTILKAPPQIVKSLLVWTREDLYNLFDDKATFQKLFREALAKEYKLAGIELPK